MSFTYPEGIRWLADTCRTALRRRAPRDRVREQRMADAAADVKRFDEQLVQVERGPAHRRARARRPSPTRAKDKSS